MLKFHKSMAVDMEHLHVLLSRGARWEASGQLHDPVSLSPVPLE
jgi:hypothetical protein